MIYDEFQKKAIEHLNSGLSVIVSAPTGAGKTAIAEHLISKCLQDRTGVIYTAPLKALSNQKFRDFKSQFPGHVGILTGDVSINPQSLVMIMTTEIFRNKVLEEAHALKQYSWIIFDEVHYIDNPERGTVWEESFIFLPEHMNILALSATIPNVHHLARWIQTIHKKEVKVVIEHKRPVPLHFYFYCHNKIYNNIEVLKKSTNREAPNRLNSLIEYIQKVEGFPCIYFVFGRNRAESLALELIHHNFLKTDESQKISSMYNLLCEKFSLQDEPSAKQIYPLIQKGIAYHHAGMLPTLKETIERLFTSRLLKIIFTTETFALGINMPSRTVIFDELKKFYGNRIENLKTRDFYQMAGRAGRRGMDKQGSVYCRINPRYTTPDNIKRIIYGNPEEVKSQFNASYSTLLNLYQRYGENFLNIYPSSLHYFQTKKYQHKETTRLMKDKINCLKESLNIKNGTLTDKGIFAKSVPSYEILLSELYEKGALEKLDKLSLGILANAIVFEPRKHQKEKPLSKKINALKQMCDNFYKKINYLESKYRIYPKSKQAHFHLAEATHMWLQGAGFQNLFQWTDTDEGDVIRYFRMSIQVLREIHNSPILSDGLKQRLKDTIHYFNRDVVDAEKQLCE